MAKKSKSVRKNSEKQKAEQNFDIEIDYQQIQGLAEHVKQVPEGLQDILDLFFTGDKTREFYLGMLAGYLHSYYIADNPDFDPPEKFIFYTMAYIAHKMLEDKIIQEYLH